MSKSSCEAAESAESAILRMARAELTMHDQQRGFASISQKYLEE